MFRLFKPEIAARVITPKLCTSLAATIRPIIRATHYAKFSTQINSSKRMVIQRNFSIQSLKKAEPYNLLSDEKIESLRIDVSPTKKKITETKDINDFASSLINYGHPKLCNLKDGKPYETYKGGFPPVPPPLIFGFRGQHHPYADLMSSVHRSNGTFLLEKAIITGFLLNHPEYKNSKSEKECELLAIMQHNNYPTRLLDFSKKIRIGAYFACQPDPLHDHHDGIIWVTNNISLNESSSLTNQAIGIALSNSFDTQIRYLQARCYNWDELMKPKNLQLLLNADDGPEVSTQSELKQLIQSYQEDAVLREKMRMSVAVDLGRLNKRIEAQYGAFTLGGGQIYHEKSQVKNPFDPPLSLVEHHDIVRNKYKKRGFLGCLLIDHASKPQIRADLEAHYGIDQHSLMLDEDSAGRKAKANQQFPKI